MRWHYYSILYFAVTIYIIIVTIKKTLKAFDDFKTIQRGIWSNVLWYLKLYIFWKFIYWNYTIHWDKTQTLKKISFGQNKRYKKCSLFSLELKLITVLLLICVSCMSLKPKVCLSKTGRVIFHFLFHFDFIKFYIFVRQKSMDYLSLKSHNSCQS